MENRLTIGGNNPPNDEELLRATLADRHAKALERAQTLIEAVERIPETCEDDTTAGKISDTMKMIAESYKTLEAQRVNEKEPYLKLGRSVDGFFKVTLDRLTQAKAKAQKPLDMFLRRKAEEERQARLAEAARLRQEAEAKAAQAAAEEQARMKAQAETTFVDARVTEQKAEAMQKSAEAKPAEMAQTRSSTGSLATLRTRWVGELVDVAHLDLEALRTHINPDALQKAVNSFVAAGGRNLRGASIYEKTESVVR